MNKIFIFVYGTLKKGKSNHNWLKQIENKFIGDALTNDKHALYNSGYGYPFLVKNIDFGHRIQGEIYEINEVDLNVLDLLEGVPTLFKRDTIKVSLNYKDMEVVCYTKAEIIQSNKLKQKELLDLW